MTEWTQEALERGGYVLLALLILLENLFPPIPSEVILPLAGARVASGDLSFGPAVAAATAGSVAGALVLYALGRLGGAAPPPPDRRGLGARLAVAPRLGRGRHGDAAGGCRRGGRARRRGRPLRAPAPPRARW